MLKYCKPYYCIINKGDLYGVDKETYTRDFKNFLMDVDMDSDGRSLNAVGLTCQSYMSWRFRVGLLDNNTIMKVGLNT